MRLLQLATSHHELLDLHPNVSVVTGLDDAARSVLVDAVTRLARAEAAAGPGLLEAHGMLFDLDASLLGLIDAGPVDIEPVVHAGQLPTEPVSLDARELRSREDAFAVLLELIGAQAARQSVARDTLAAATTALERAHVARAEATAGADGREQDRDRLALRLEELIDERRTVRKVLGETRHRLAASQSLTGDVVERTAALQEAWDAAIGLRMSIEAELEALDVLPDPSLEDVDDSVEGVGSSGDADGRVRELEQLLMVVDPVERSLVEAALAQMPRRGSAAVVPSADAKWLADELDRLDPAEEGPDDLTDEGSGTMSRVDADDRLEVARRALLDAEHAVRTPELDREDVVLLEDIHGELIDSIDKAEGRFGRARAANRVIEFRAAEQEVLDRLGFTSYSAYMMGYSLNHTDPAKEAALDTAREELAAAEDASMILQGASGGDLERAAGMDRRRELLRRAEELLGHPVTEAPQDELRALRVPALPPAEAASVLRAALDAVGVDVGEGELDEEDLEMIAEAWLAEGGQVDARRREAVEELAAARAGDVGPSMLHGVADARRVALGRDLVVAREMERSASDTAKAASAEITSEVAEVAALQERLAELEPELERCDIEVAEAEQVLAGVTAAADLPDLDIRLDAAKAMHAEARVAMEMINQTMATLDAEGRAEALEIERLQDVVAAQGTGSATPAEELEWYLLARLAAQRAVSIAGSVPLLLDEALRGLGIEEVCHLLTRLERMADVVQVIVISDDPVAASWAVTTGASRAAVVSPGAR